MANRLICVLLLLTGGVQAQVYLSRTVQTAILKPIPAVSYLLDNLSTAPASAYSLRKLRSGYTGPAIRVRRSSDNTESDIGFTGGGLLDQTALLSFVGSGSGYVRTWYDQTGSVNFAQTSTGNQPRIVNSGVVVLANSVPAIQAIASNTTYMDAALTVNTTTLATVSVAALTSSAGQYGRFLSVGAAGQNDYNNSSYAVPLDRAGTNAQVQAERNGSFGQGNVTYGATFTHSAKWDGTNLAVALNGTTISTTGSSGNFGASLVRLFSDTSNQYTWDGTGQEVLIFTTNVPTTSDLTAIQASQKSFYTTP